MMTSGSKLCALAAVLAVQAEAGYRFGSCPTKEEYQPLPELDIDQYEGRWYNIMKDKSSIFQIGWDCMVSEFSQRPDDEYVDIMTRYYQTPYRTWKKVRGYGVLHADGDAKVNAKYTGGFPDPTDKETFTVFEIVYDQYKVLYVCRDVLGGLMIYDYVDIWSRTPTMDQNLLIEIIGRVRAQFPDYRFLQSQRITKQGYKNCDYASLPP